MAKLRLSIFNKSELEMYKMVPERVAILKYFLSVIYYLTLFIVRYDCA